MRATGKRMQHHIRYVSPTLGVMEARLRENLLEEPIVDERLEQALRALEGIVNATVATAAHCVGEPSRLFWTTDGITDVEVEEFPDRIQVTGKIAWEFGQTYENFTLDVARRQEPFLYSIKFRDRDTDVQALYIGRELAGWLVSAAD